MRRNRIGVGTWGLAAISAVLMFAHSVRAGTRYEILHSFANNRDSSSNPEAGVIFDTAGNLYGTTSYYYGEVFELVPHSGHWSETTLYKFKAGSDGWSPWAPLVFDRAGNLYGTTVGGGLGCNESGCGTIFELSPVQGGHWDEKVLYRFRGGYDGEGPQAGLVLDASGNLYGTTTWGGDPSCNRGTGCGTVFELTPNRGGWTETVLHAFAGGRDGAYPFLAGVILDSKGNLYGTTIGYTVGTPEGTGTVFQLTRSANGRWKHRVLYKFPGGSNGYPAAGLTLGVDGNLYGTTQGGGPQTICCSTVFQLKRSRTGWQETTLHSFTGADGAFPLAGVIFDKKGNLYGITPEGGPGHCFAGCGVVFKLERSKNSWTETVLHSFGVQPYDGYYPVGGLTFDQKGVLYGTTTYGGKAAYGTVFRIAP
jgi:uncharacterized repeat protein (TIGR03803 family)